MYPNAEWKQQIAVEVNVFAYMKFKIFIKQYYMLFIKHIHVIKI